jgi:hypothetical protein
MERKLCVFQAFLFTKTKSNWIKFQLRNKIRYFLHYFAPGDTFRNTTPHGNKRFSFKIPCKELDVLSELCLQDKI